jgi:hypothetical protein
MAVAVRVSQFSFSIYRHNLTGNAVKFGYAELPAGRRFEFGDEEFDRRLCIVTNDCDKMKALLIPELRKEISESPDYIGEFCLEFGWLRYREWANWGIFANAKRVARYEGMLARMCNLADAVEVVAERS